MTVHLLYRLEPTKTGLNRFRSTCIDMQHLPYPRICTHISMEPTLGTNGQKFEEENVVIRLIITGGFNAASNIVRSHHWSFLMRIDLISTLPCQSSVQNWKLEEKTKVESVGENFLRIYLFLKILHKGRCPIVLYFVDSFTIVFDKWWHIS